MEDVVCVCACVCACVCECVLMCVQGEGGSQSSQFISAIMVSVLLLGRGWKLRYLCVIYLQAAQASIFLGDDIRTLEMYTISLLIFTFADCWCDLELLAKC